MADKTDIEWTDATWNPITGCSVVSPGCTNCYAMKLAGTRLKDHPSRRGLTADSKAGPVWNGQVRFNPEWLDQPLRWKRPRRIFVCAHGDLFHESVPDAWIDQVFAVMALAPQHTFQVLTKRSARMRAYMAGLVALFHASPDGLYERVGEAFADLAFGEPDEARAAFDVVDWPLPNVWLGVSAEDQPRADERIPDLLATPAAVRFASLEPLLGPVDLDAPQENNGWLSWVEFGLDWVIVGGENGPRPMHPDWVRQVRDQCSQEHVPFFFKQWGSWQPVEAVEGPHGPLCALTAAGHRVPVGAIPAEKNEDGWTAWIFEKVGKMAAGRLLDGVEHNGMPGR